MDIITKESIIPESEKMKYYIEEAKEASKRSRKMILFLIFSSVVAFANFWNSRPQGWAHQRYNTINKAYKAFIIDKLNDSSKHINFSRDKIITQEYLKDTVSLADFLEQRSINTNSEIESLKKIYLDIYESTYSVKIPIIGVNFDINDLGLFTGITLSLILFLLCFCLERESSNLNFAFAEAKRIDLLEEYYKILSLSQVLTVPGKKNSEPSLAWQILSKMPLLFPLFTQYLIFKNDLDTTKVVQSISASATTTYNTANIASLIVILFLTLACIIYILKIDSIWVKYYKVLYPESY